MTTAQTEPASEATYIDAVIELEHLVPSPINPRRTFDPKKLGELADSLRQFGVMQPIIVRPHKTQDRYELIFGERRRRAAKLAGLTGIPARIRAMTDLEVLEAQLVENDQREDVHPLEEADGYRLLREEHGKTVEQIAEKLGRPRSHVYQRLTLCSLKTAARALFLAGKLSASTALLVARIPDEKLQAKAAKEIAEGPMDQPMSATMAADHVQRNYMLRLELASFDTRSELLVPQAGSCVTCQKRTGNQRELFADVKSADICTDPPCYEKKAAAGWKLATTEAEQKGHTVLSDAQCKKVFPYPGKADRLSYSADYVDLRDKPFEDKKGRTYAQLLGREPEGMVLARDQGGGVHKLYPKKQIKAALKDAGHDLWKAEREAKKASSDPKERERQKKAADKQRAEADAREAVNEAIAAELEGKLEKHEPSVAQWTALLELALGEGMTSPAFYRRCGLSVTETKHGGCDNRKLDKELLAKAAKMPAGRVRALFVSAMLFEDRYDVHAEVAARAFGVDVKAVRARVVAAAKAKAEADKAVVDAEPTKRKTKAGKKR